MDTVNSRVQKPRISISSIQQKKTNRKIEAYVSTVWPFVFVSFRFFSVSEGFFLNWSIFHGKVTRSRIIGFGHCLHHHHRYHFISF